MLIIFFLKRKNGMTKQYLFMYRRIWFPLVVYYKLALVQIRIYWQQHMVGKEVFGRKSNSTPWHKLYKVPKSLSTFCPQILSTKIWKNGISSSNDFCCFQKSFVTSTSAKVSHSICSFLKSHQLLLSHHRLIADVMTSKEKWKVQHACVLFHLLYYDVKNAKILHANSLIIKK